MLLDLSSPSSSERSLPDTDENIEKNVPDSGEEFNGEEYTLPRKTVIATYREVWTQFYAWEQAYCETSLSSLNVIYEQDDAFDTFDPVSQDDYLWPNNELSEEQEDEQTVVVELSSGQIENVKGKIFLAPELTPCPTYEACTPSTINIGPPRHDLLEWETLRFFPYLDNPEFGMREMEKIARLYDTGFFQWTEHLELRDADVEQIQYETLRRLLGLPNTKLANIAGMKDSPLIEINEGDSSGLLWANSQRDMLPCPWTAFTQEKDYIKEVYPSTYQNPSSDELARIESHAEYFCASLNCITPLCRSHPEPPPRRAEISEDLQMNNPKKCKPIVPEPRLKSDDLRKSIIRPCGKDCFLICSIDHPPSINWDDKANLSLRAILSVCPDLAPCHLVFACRKPCYEVFLQRQAFLPDSRIVKQSTTVSRTVSQKVQKKIHMDYLTQPCRHEGPCGIQSNCLCFKTRVYCQRSCWCDINCIHRWAGCKCRAKKKSFFEKGRDACDNATCPCVSASRECDPELCKGCKCKKLGSKSPECKNSHMQRGTTKSMRIASSDYGFGAFMNQEVKKDDLLGEYVAEIYFSEATDVRSFHDKFRKRNYEFSLQTHEETNIPDSMKIVNDEYLDAACISNELRFPNHSHEKPNCEAKNKLINGQYRIGIYATGRIKKDEEVLLDYGADFFNGE